MTAKLDLAAGLRLYKAAIANGLMYQTTDKELAAEHGRMLLSAFNSVEATEVEARDALHLLGRRTGEDRTVRLAPGDLLEALAEVRERNGTTRALPAPKDCPRCAGPMRGFEIVTDDRGVARARRCTHEPRPAPPEPPATPERERLLVEAQEQIAALRASLGRARARRAHAFKRATTLELRRRPCGDGDRLDAHEGAEPGDTAGLHGVDWAAPPESA